MSFFPSWGLYQCNELALAGVSLNTLRMVSPAKKINLSADFCSARSVLLVAVSMVLLAAVILLVPGENFMGSLELLGIQAMFLQWLGLTCLAILCLLNRWLRNLSLVMSTIIIFLVIQLVTLMVSESAYQLTLMQPMLQSLRPEQHGLFLLRNTAISMIISSVVLWVMYLLQQLQVHIEAESQARIRALQARIRPHLLFNSMNTIAALTQIDADAAEQAILDLSEIYRVSLKSGDSTTTLKKEIDLTRHYLAVEKLRLGQRLQILWNINDAVLNVSIPALTIQPLVENAVYHGIEPRSDGGWISISAVLDGEVKITITNPLPTRDDDTLRRGNQMAIANISERLGIMYGNRASLQSSQDMESYYVLLTLPYEGKT